MRFQSTKAPLGDAQPLSAAAHEMGGVAFFALNCETPLLTAVPPNVEQ